MWWRVIKLSVLVCGLYERMAEDTGTGVIWNLAHQAKDRQVEVLYLADNLKMSVGRKRNILLSIAQGEWFAFVDDDDEVVSDYVDRLLTAIPLAGDAGVICFPQRCEHASGKIEHCKYGLGYEYASTVYNEEADVHVWTGRPAHTQCWRTEAVNMVEFPEANFGEDVGWVARACQRVSKEYRIPDCPELYTYRFDPAKSRTRG